MSEDKQNKAPTHNVFTVVNIDGQEKGRWLEIGAAWPTKDGEGFTITLNANPLDGRLVVLPRKATHDQEE